ncbi:hypothetical protein [Prauserella muralis]|uniref:Uncharacterized protein n=1 Tax=Prauserella muralis TaxID=588067 RepID=A0A2V4B2R6_9PSEU|nr:hypothetical protein [Prauserella muralis]PXY27435.1 hypothetical protein BAY60_13450 [Prauserella muralis]TWE22865.1 hypothetical protein FHX69_4121 [Prauserella muralis]
MSKQSGLGDALYVAGHNLSGDIGSLGRIGGGPATLPVTGIDKSAFERIGGLRDGSLEFSAWFNPETAADNPPNTEDRAHAILSGLPTADQIVTYCRGTALGKPGACLVGKQINYDPTRGDDGSLTIAVQALGNAYGLEWATRATDGIRTDAAATDGAGQDYGAATAFGLQAYLHVFAFTGTDATIKLQESADDGAVDPWTDVVGGAFTALTAGPTAERIATARDQAVERYLRVVTTTTGGFSNLEFAVFIAKNDVEVTY